ncbi:unnamed protein product [Calypogeia fissa]
MESSRKCGGGGRIASRFGSSTVLMMTMEKLVVFVVLVMALVASTAEATSLDRPLYEVLDVAHNATMDDIEEAYEQHAQTWSPEKRYQPSEIQDILEIEHAYQVLSHNLRRRDYDYFRHDPLQVEVDNIRGQYEGRTQALFVEFPLWVPKVLDNGIESTAEVVTYQNFGDLVLYSSDLWLIQIYSVADPQSHEFAPIWNRIVDLMEGVVRVGRLELQEMPLALILSERNWLHGNAFYRNGFPAIIAVQPGCRKMDCIDRYYEEKTSEAIVDWVGSRLLRLPRILYYNAQSLMTEIIQKPGPHKVKVIQFSTTGERAPLHLRKAARDYWQYAVFAMVLWRESEATFWESRVGVEAGPATVFLKDPGLPPVIHHGKLTSSDFRDLMEQHKTFELPQLRSITSADLGCDVSNHSRAGNETKIWYCVIVAGRPGLELNQLRGVVRGVQEQLTISSTEEISTAPGVKAFKDKRLSLAWLDGETQKAYCFFYLSSATMYEACGPKKYEFDEIPKIFLIRFIRIEVKKEPESGKKRWLPKTKWEVQAEEESKYAAQLVTKYNGSAYVSEIMEWISTMVTQGDDEGLPSFSGKSPDLVEEEKIPFSAKTQEFIADKRVKLVNKGKGISYLVQDLVEDPKFFPLVLFVALFYGTACYCSAKQKHRRFLENQAAAEAASTEAAAPGVEADVSPDSSPTPPQESIISDVSSEHKASLTAEGLRKREPFQSS